MSDSIKQGSIGEKWNLPNICSFRNSVGVFWVCMCEVFVCEKDKCIQRFKMSVEGSELKEATAKHATDVFLYNGTILCVCVRACTLNKNI